MDVRVFTLLVLVAAANAMPFEELFRAKRQQDDEGAGPIIILETGGNVRRNRPSFIRPFFNPFFDDGDEDPFFGSETRTEEIVPPAEPEPSPFGGFGGFGSDFGFGVMNHMNRWMQDMQKKVNRMWDQVYRQPPKTLPPGYSNSTSTTKVVNGSVITVNETIHKSGDNDSVSYFHFKVMHVSPENMKPGREEEDKPIFFHRLPDIFPREREELKPRKQTPFPPEKRLDMPSPDDHVHVEIELSSPKEETKTENIDTASSTNIPQNSEDNEV